MNMFKKNGGFTLVELIVVIAILAILAGVAIPAYSGYIEKANKTTDDAQINVINTTIQAACAWNGGTASEATATIDGTAVTKLMLGTKDITADYTELYTGNTVALKHYASLKWENGVVVGVE